MCLQANRHGENVRSAAVAAKSPVSESIDDAAQVSPRSVTLALAITSRSSDGGRDSSDDRNQNEHQTYTQRNRRRAGRAHW